MRLLQFLNQNLLALRRRQALRGAVVGVAKEAKEEQDLHQRLQDEEGAEDARGLLPKRLRAAAPVGAGVVEATHACRILVRWCKGLQNSYAYLYIYIYTYIYMRMRIRP